MKQLILGLLTQTDETHVKVYGQSVDQNNGFAYTRLDVDLGNAIKIPLDLWKPREGGANTQATMRATAQAYLAHPEVHADLLTTAERLVLEARALPTQAVTGC